jgi:hypothetical protein
MAVQTTIAHCLAMAPRPAGHRRERNSVPTTSNKEWAEPFLSPDCKYKQPDLQTFQSEFGQPDLAERNRDHGRISIQNWTLYRVYSSGREYWVANGGERRDSKPYLRKVLDIAGKRWVWLDSNNNICHQEAGAC